MAQHRAPRSIIDRIVMIALYIIGLAFLAVFTFDLAMVITEIVVK